MRLAGHKTKIVATIGPASESPEVMRQMIDVGMDVARINFSHGDFGSHQRVMSNLRQTAQAAGRRLAILADLPGPKMRLGRIFPEPAVLAPGASFSLTTEEVIGDASHAMVSFASLPQAVKPGDTLLLADGLIQL